MVDLRKIVEFEWDEGNIDKSYEKHGITAKETEELFLDEHVLLLEDIKHSQEEKRLIAIGKNTQRKLLFAVFTLRNNRIRIISVRKANNRERRQYEEEV